MKILSLFLFALLLISAAVSENTVEELLSEGEFSNLIGALDALGVSLPDSDYTLFAPNNAGLTRIPDSDVLADVISYHLVSGAYLPAETVVTLDGTVADLPSGETLKVDITADGVALNNGQALVVETDAAFGDNSVVHVISQGSGGLGYLIPRSFDRVNTLLALGLRGLVDAAVANSIPVDAIGTLFAPERIAEDADVSFEFLAYHALATKVRGEDLSFPLYPQTLEGSRLFITATSDASRVFFNGVEFSKSPLGNPYFNIETDGTFVYHLLERSLPYPETDIATAAATVDILSTLVELLSTAEISLPADGTLTVFAPSNAAFDRLSRSDRRYLQRNPDKLVDMLLYHALADVVVSGQLSEEVTVETLSGASLTIDGNNFNNQELDFIATDLFFTNGVVHIIDTVLIPPNFPPRFTKYIRSGNRSHRSNRY